MIKTSLVVAISTVLSVSAAAAAGRLEGAYIADTTQLCQVINSPTNVPLHGGAMEQSAGTITFANGKATIDMIDFWGRIITVKRNVRSQPDTAVVTSVLTGTKNPYKLTLNGLDNIAYLGRIDGSGIAHRAVVIQGFSSSGTGTPNCVTKMVLDRE